MIDDFLLQMAAGCAMLTVAFATVLVVWLMVMWVMSRFVVVRKHVPKTKPIPPDQVPTATVPPWVVWVRCDTGKGRVSRWEPLVAGETEEVIDAVRQEYPLGTFDLVLLEQGVEPDGTQR